MLCVETSSLQQKPGNESSQCNRYHTWILRDLPTIFDKVVPENQAGLVNVLPARTILRNFEEKQFLNDDEIKALDEWLDSRSVDWYVTSLYLKSSF